MTPYRYEKHTRIQDLILVINLRGASRYCHLFKQMGSDPWEDRTERKMGQNKTVGCFSFCSTSNRGVELIQILPDR